jgi:hypothetical protein
MTARIFIMAGVLGDEQTTIEGHSAEGALFLEIEDMRHGNSEAIILDPSKARELAGFLNAWAEKVTQ